MPGLLTALRNGFGEPAIWMPLDRRVPAMPVEGRFRVDPYDVPLGGQPEPLNTTQTWFYCDTRDIAADEKPRLGDRLWIRDGWWEIVQLDRDDIGELAYRLLKDDEW